MPSVERCRRRKHHSLRLLQYHLREAPSLQVPDLREDILLERRNSLPSTPTPSCNLRRSCHTQRRGSEQVCNRTGKADRSPGILSLAGLKGQPTFVVGSMLER